MNKKFINKRKKKILNIKLIFLYLFFFFIIIYIYINSQKISNLSQNIIQNYSNKYEYNFINVDISNLKYIPKIEILEYFEKYQNKSIFLIPIKKIANEMRLNKWIQNLHLKNDYKNTIIVSLEEETPLGVYFNNNQRILFSENLKFLEILDIDSNYLELITFYGENSIMNSKNLIINMNIDFISEIKSATYIKNRRWNIELKNLILLKLPEENIKDAINNYNKIYKNFSNKELEDVSSIDLRINNKAIIKYKN